MDEQVNFIQSTNQDQALNDPALDSSHQNTEKSPNSRTIEKPDPPVLSSCNCYSCKTNLFKLTKQTPKNCNFAKELECKNRINSP